MLRMFSLYINGHVKHDIYTTASQHNHFYISSLLQQSLPHLMVFGMHPEVNLTHRESRKKRKRQGLDSGKITRKQGRLSAHMEMNILPHGSNALGHVYAQYFYV